MTANVIPITRSRLYRPRHPKLRELAAIDAKISEAERERATCLAEKRALELRGGSRERRRVLSFYIGELRRDLDALTKERVRLLIELGTEAAR